MLLWQAGEGSQERGRLSERLRELKRNQAGFEDTQAGSSEFIPDFSVVKDNKYLFLKVRLRGFYGGVCGVFLLVTERPLTISSASYKSCSTSFIIKYELKMR